MTPALLALLLFAQTFWDTALADGAAAMNAGQYARALEIDDRLIADMIAGLFDEHLFGAAIAQKAAALDGLGRHADASLFADLARFAGAESSVAQPALSDARRVGGAVKPPKLTHRVEPRYPSGARRLHISGVVILECVVDKDGVIRRAHVIRGLAMPSFAYAAVDAVRQWRFQPGTVDGQPVDVIFNLTVSFRSATIP